jgi:hypothetical protein
MVLPAHQLNSLLQSELFSPLAPLSPGVCPAAVGGAGEFSTQEPDRTWNFPYVLWCQRSNPEPLGF